MPCDPPPQVDAASGQQLTRVTLIVDGKMTPVTILDSDRYLYADQWVLYSPKELIDAVPDLPGHRSMVLRASDEEPRR